MSKLPRLPKEYLMKVWELSQKVTGALVSTRVIIQILLMIRLGIPPLTRRQDLSDNLATLPPLLLDLLRHLARNLFLLGVVEEDAAAVLAARVGPLAVVCRRVVHFVEELEQRAVADLFWVVHHLQRLGVSSASAAHSAVRRVRCVASNVPDSSVVDLLLGEMVAVEVFDAPEAACCDGGASGAFGNRLAARLGVETHCRRTKGPCQALDDARHVH